MLSSPIFILSNIKSFYYLETPVAFAGRNASIKKCMKMGYDRIYQASNTCVFVLVECPAPQASFIVQFLVVAWELHREGEL